MVRVAGGAEVVLFGEGERGDVGQPAHGGGVGEACVAEAVAVEGRVREEVGHLRTVGGVVPGGLVGPGRGLDVGGVHRHRAARCDGTTRPPVPFVIDSPLD